MKIVCFAKHKGGVGSTTLSWALSSVWTEKLKVLIWDFDPQATLNRPRFCLTEGAPDSDVSLEEGIPARTMSALAERGHRVKRVSGYARALFGRGQIIRREPDGVLWGGSDPRADGCAMGY